MKQTMTYKLTDADINNYKDLIAIRDQMFKNQQELTKRISEEIREGVWLCHAHNYGSHGYLDLRIFKLNPNHTENLRSLNITEDYFGDHKVSDLLEEGLIENYWDAEYEISTNLIHFIKDLEWDGEDVDHTIESRLLLSHAFGVLRDAIETRELSITF